MAYELKDNTGNAFPNTKTNDNQPDFKGTVMVDGVKKEVAIWVKEGNNGIYYSMKFNPPYVKPQN